MGFVSCNFIGQASFTCKLALSFCHFKSGGQEGDIEKQKFYKKQKFLILLLLAFKFLVFLMLLSVAMAATSTRQYNLRSGNQETLQFPVQLQLEDGKFLTELLKQQNGQVLDSESSISESDCEALIASDSESDGEQPEPSSRKDKVIKESSSVTQDVINEKILAQLDKLGKRLDSIESNVSKQGFAKNKCKKSKADSSVTVSPRAQVNKIPDLTALRQDMSVQALVDQHLKLLADAEKTGTKIKSLRGVP